MDYLFLDTSIFVNENFLESQKMREVFRLSYEGHIKLVLPIITYNEVLAQIENSILKAEENYKSFRDKARVLRNLPDLIDRFNKIDTPKVISELQSLFKERITSMNSIILEYPTLNIESVFEKYFNKSFPFGNKDKKHEFPDAFTLATIENWCIQQGHKCIIISKDKDIINYKSKYFKFYTSLEEYLDITLRKIDFTIKRRKRLELATTLFRKKHENLERELKDWLERELKNEYNYVIHSLDEINSIDIHYNDVRLDDDCQVTSVTEYNILLNSNANVEIEVSLYLNAEDDYWTNENEMEIEKRFIIPITFEVDIPLAGDQYMDIRISEINNGKELQLH